MPRGPGELGRFILTYLQVSVEKEGRSEWVSIIDLTRIRLSQDSPPSRRDVEATRKTIARFQEQGLVQVETQPRLVTRVVVSTVTNSAPKEIEEARDVVVVRLTPTLRQRLEEALVEVQRCESVVADRPGWQYAEKALADARREAQRLAAQVEVENSRV
jgi:hypothetical protein